MSSPPKRKKTRISVIKGPTEPVHLLRLPPETNLRSPASLSEEEVVIHDEDHEKPAAGGGASKKKLAKVVMKRWVFSNTVQTLQGFTMPLDDTYMAMVMAPGGGSLQLIPLQSLVSLRPGIPGRQADDDALIQEYLRTGSKFRAQASTWNSRYGAELVGMVERGQEDYDGGESEKGKRSEQAWTRRFNPDDDENDYILPTSRVALNYNDLLGLGHDEDADGGGDVIEAVHQATDLGQDEIPDGAEEGFGGLEFGEETRRDQGAPIVAHEEEQPRGLFGSDEDDDDTSEAGGGKWSDEDDDRVQREQHPQQRRVQAPATSAQGQSNKAQQQPDTDSDFSAVDDDDDDDDVDDGGPDL